MLPSQHGECSIHDICCKELDKDIAADGLSLFDTSGKQMIMKENWAPSVISRFTLTYADCAYCIVWM
jgi:hypothetical protein